MSDIPPLMTDRPPTQISAQSIGSNARLLLKKPGRAMVKGVISRGIFVHLYPNRIIFLSNEPYHGPLTINIPPQNECLANVMAGDPVQVQPGILNFSALGIALTTLGARIWRSKLTNYSGEPFEQIILRLSTLIAAVKQKKNDVGLIRFLPTTNPARESAETSPAFPDLPRMLEACRTSVSAGLLPASAAVFGKFLGLGSGLTPSGDDLLIGVLLTLSSFPTFFEPTQTRAFKQALITAAYARTTTLSANLIECAASGQSDERLINAITGIVTGSPSIETCVEALCSWGNSSGADALVGMSLMVEAIPWFK